MDWRNTQCKVQTCIACPCLTEMCSLGATPQMSAAITHNGFSWGEFLEPSYMCERAPAGVMRSSEPHCARSAAHSAVYLRPRLGCTPAMACWSEYVKLAACVRAHALAARRHSVHSALRAALTLGASGLFISQQDKGFSVGTFLHMRLSPLSPHRAAHSNMARACHRRAHPPGAHHEQGARPRTPAVDKPADEYVTLRRAQAPRPLALVRPPGALVAGPVQILHAPLPMPAVCSPGAWT